MNVIEMWRLGSVRSGGRSVHEYFLSCPCVYVCVCVCGLNKEFRFKAERTASGEFVCVSVFQHESVM